MEAGEDRVIRETCWARSMKVTDGDREGEINGGDGDHVVITSKSIYVWTMLDQWKERTSTDRLERQQAIY